MYMQVRKLRQIDLFFLIVLIAYAFDFGTIKYAMAWCFSGIYLLGGRLLERPTLRGLGKEYLMILKGVVILFIITIVLQIANGFNSYVINEAVYFFTPIIFVMVYSQLSKKEDMISIYYYLFIVFVVAFLRNFAGLLTIENIRSISFVNSFSPFESELAYVFLMFECFFLFQNKRKYAIISLILCILSFKRFCMIMAIFFYLSQKWITKKEPIKKRTVIILTICFVVLPVVTCLILNDSFESWFYNTFNVTLDEITLSRSSRLEAVINSGQIKYGLGSVTTYLTQYLNAMHGSNFASRSLHNDLVQIYLECGVFGSLIFTYIYLKAASVSITSFVLMCYVFFECYFNHLFGAGCTHIWILIFLLISITGLTVRNENVMEIKNGENNGFYTHL